MRQTMDGAAFARMIVSASAAIEQKKQKINELNVFPVPDGDTGTNMSMTLAAAAQDLKKRSPESLTKAADMTASALLRGARGNSGVILSLLFRGFSKSLKGKLEANGKDFAEALSAGVEAAYKAVMKPAEGTILTVSRLTGDAARDLAADDANLESVLMGSIETAKVALENTVNQNPVLKKAGVVDAGGMGFVVILEGMLASLQGNDVALQENAGETKEQADFTDFATEDITFAYDTVYIVRKKDETVSLEPLRVYLDSIGDSLVIGEDDEAFKVHVHTNIPWEALAESQKYGTLELAKIENMRMQHDDLAEGRKARSTDDLDAIEQELEAGDTAKPAPAAPEKPFGFVAVCVCHAVDREFRAGKRRFPVPVGQRQRGLSGQIDAPRRLRDACQQAQYRCQQYKGSFSTCHFYPPWISSAASARAESSEEAAKPELPAPAQRAAGQTALRPPSHAFSPPPAYFLPGARAPEAGVC